MMKKRSTVLALMLTVLVAGSASAKKLEKKKDREPAKVEQVVSEPAAAEPRDESAIWSDPQFRKEFLGSFGVNAEIEPGVSAVEYETMQEILPLLGSDSEAAVAALEKALEDETASAVFDFTLGNVHFQEERLEQAAKHYRAALEKFPSFRRAQKNLGLIHVRAGECGRAVGPLSRVIELGGNEALTYGLLGQCYVELERYIAAESAYRSAMMLQPERLHWKLGLTQSALRQEKYAEALTLGQQLLDEDPDNADYWMIQANAYIGLGRPLEAAGNYEIVRRMGKATRQSLYTLGDIYVNEGLWELASGAYADAFEADPDQQATRPLRCVEILAQRSALAEAKSLLTRAKRTFGETLDDEQRIRLLKIEARIAVAEGAGGGAVGVLEEIVALDPLDGEALLLLGQHYERTGEVERAAFYYERAMGIEAYEADANVRKAQLLVGGARYAEAVPLLKRAQEIAPRETVARYLEQVERIALSTR